MRLVDYRSGSYVEMIRNGDSPPKQLYVRGRRSSALRRQRRL